METFYTSGEPVCLSLCLQCLLSLDVRGSKSNPNSLLKYNTKVHLYTYAQVDAEGREQKIIKESEIVSWE